jgi:ech hydrogenase subunit A
MNTEWVYPSIILLPILVGAACLVLKKNARPLVVLSSLAMFCLAVLVYLGGNKTATYHLEVAAGLDIIEVADYLLMAVFLYIGIKFRHLLSALLAAGQAVTIFYYDFFIRSWEPGTTLIIDELAILLLLICCVVGGLIMIYATKYMETDARQGSFYAVMLIFIGSMNGAVMSNNMAWLFFFWEMTTLCSFLLINHDRTDESGQSALRALWMTLLGGLSLAIGITLVGLNSHTGSLDILSPGKVLIIVPLIFLVIAAFTKSALYPFQSWLLGAMVAPTPVSALLHSATMVNLGIYFLFRLNPIFSAMPHFNFVLSLIGGSTFLFAAIQAIPQEDVKRLLAYSTISNLGLIVLSIGVGSKAALVAALTLLFFHALAKGLLFLCSGVVYKTIHSRQFDQWSGLVTNMPFITLMIFIGVFALMALPFGAFVTKWILVQSAISSPIILPFVILGTSFSIFFYSQWLGRTLAEPPKHVEKVSYLYAMPLATLTVGILLSSVFIARFVRFALYAVKAQPIETVSDYAIRSTIGFFSSLPLFVILLISVLIPTFFWRFGKRKLSQEYTCGKYMRPTFHGYYFKGLLDEKKWNRVLVPVATLLILSLFLVVVL